MDKEKIIEKTVLMVKQKFLQEGSGHDRWHIERVRKNALHIWKGEGGDKFVVELGALLHDVADWKFHDGNDYVGGIEVRKRLESLHVDEEIICAVVHIIDSISYKGAGVANNMQSKEGFIVQDADRLDAIGAIGIARAFAYGGSKGNVLRDPEEKKELHQTAESYKKKKSSSIQHFYEKLLLLKDRMNTDTAKKIAQDRHEYMEQFLEQFFAEWKGER